KYMLRKCSIKYLPATQVGKNRYPISSHKPLKKENSLVIKKARILIKSINYSNKSTTLKFSIRFPPRNLFHFSNRGCSNLNSRYLSGLIIGIPDIIGYTRLQSAHNNIPSRISSNSSRVIIFNFKSAWSKGQHNFFTVFNFIFIF